MAKIFRKHIIGFRQFFAPAESFALNQLFSDMAAWKTAQLAKGTFIPIDKFKPRLRDGLMLLGNKKAVMDVLDPRTPKTLRRLSVVGKAVRPALNLAGNNILTLSSRRLGAVFGLSLNLLRVGPLDIIISAAFAVHELRRQDFETQFGVQDGDPTQVEFEAFGIKGKGIVSRESLGAAFLVTETVDQLAFGLVTEAAQDKQTFFLAALLEPPIQLLKILGPAGRLAARGRS